MKEEEKYRRYVPSLSLRYKIGSDLKIVQFVVEFLMDGFIDSVGRNELKRTNTYMPLHS